MYGGEYNTDGVPRGFPADQLARAVGCCFLRELREPLIRSSPRYLRVHRLFRKARLWSVSSNKIVTMRKALPLFLIAVCFLTSCGKSKSSTASANSSGAGSSGDDVVQKKLQELAGSGAKNCGLLKSQATGETAAASKCAVEASKAKTPFYVEYEMPGMNVAIAGNAQGKLFAVQSQAGGAGLTSGDCPAELRVAPSGRLTCYAPGTFPMGAGAGSHSNMSMPPAMGMGSPHGGAGAVPPGHPNPHKDQKPPQP